MKKIFIQFAPKFLWWPLAVVKEIHRRRPNIEFCGLATGSKRVFKTVSEAEAPRIHPVDRLDDLERQWLATPCDPEHLAEYENRLGPGALRRIVVADRNLGIGFVETGAKMPRTRLMDRMTDPEMVRRYVLGLLDHCFGILERAKPDLAFFYAVAGAPAVAMAEACDSMGVPVARYSNARVGNLFIVDDGPVQSLEPVRRVFEQAVRDPEIVAGHLPAAREFLSRFRARPEPPGYSTFLNRKAAETHSIAQFLQRALRGGERVLSGALRPWEKDLRTATVLRRLLFEFEVALKSRRLARRWPYFGSEALPDAPFAYFPLQTYPEESTMVFAPMHTNQLAIVEFLAKSLPLGMNLVAKENPPMLGRRPPGFYERITGMPSVILVPPHVDSLSLIQKASFTSAITSTAAWEAMLLKRPALIIGNSPHLCLEQGFVYCPDVTRLPDAVARVLNVTPVDDERLELYLAALFSQAVKFPVAIFQTSATEETVRENPYIVDHLATNLIERLDRGAVVRPLVSRRAYRGGHARSG